MRRPPVVLLAQQNELFALLLTSVHQGRCTRPGDCKHFVDPNHSTPKDNDIASVVLYDLILGGGLASVVAEIVRESQEAAWDDGHKTKTRFPYGDNPYRKDAQ